MIEIVNLRKSYRFYRDLHPDKQIEKYEKDSLITYLDIVNGLMEFMMKKVWEGNDVMLGAKLGRIGIRGEKVKPIIVKDKDGKETIRGVAPDWGATKKLQAIDPIAKQNKTIVYCFNEHSGGIKYDYCWWTGKLALVHKSFYGFTFSRTNRRTLVSMIKKERKEYLIRVKKIKPEKIKKNEQSSPSIQD